MLTAFLDVREDLLVQTSLGYARLEDLVGRRHLREAERSRLVQVLDGVVDLHLRAEDLALNFGQGSATGSEEERNDGQPRERSRAETGRGIKTG